MQALAPYLISGIFVLAIMAFCFWRPNAGRLFLGFFYLAMALGVNGAFILTSPGSYAGYIAGSYWPLYRGLALWTVSLLGPVAFGVLLAAFEMAVAILLLGSGQRVKIGLIGVVLFILGIAPLSTLQLPWLGLAVAAGYLLRGEFSRSLFAMLFDRTGKSGTARHGAPA